MTAAGRSALTADDRRFLKGAENWGAWYTHPQCLPAGRELVYMFRSGHGRVRFYSPGPGLGGAGVRQVGPDLPSIVAATYWAYRQQWWDPEATGARNRACVMQVWTESGPDHQPHPLEATR